MARWPFTFGALTLAWAAGGCLIDPEKDYPVAPSRSSPSNEGGEPGLGGAGGGGASEAGNVSEAESGDAGSSGSGGEPSGVHGEPQIACGAQTCSAYCCPEGGPNAAPHCASDPTECEYVSMACDGPEDCPEPQACCIQRSAAPRYGPGRATCALDCAASIYDIVACHVAGDCPSGAACGSGALADDGYSPTLLGCFPVTPCDRSTWSASAHTTFNAELPERAIDGDSTTRWSNGTPRAESQWFELDLGGVYELATLTQLNPKYPTDLPPAVSVTLDGTPAEVELVQEQGALKATFSSPRPARVVRLELPAEAADVVSWWSIAELEATCR